MFRYNLPFFRIIFIYHVYHDKRYLKMTCMKTPCTFGDLFLLGRNVKEVTFFNVGYIYLFGKNDTPLGKGLDYGPAWECLTMLGVCRSVLQILIPFQTKNCLFSLPFSDLASKIHTHSRA